jgi:hypothetical protein
MIDTSGWYRIPEAWIAERDALGAQIKARLAYLRTLEWCVDDLYDAWQALPAWGITEAGGVARLAYERAEDALTAETDELRALEQRFFPLQGRIYDELRRQGWD